MVAPALPEPVGPVRQWMCFPPGLEQTVRRPAPVQRFRILLETIDGRVHLLAIAQRQPPPERLLAEIATVLSDPLIWPDTPERRAGELFSRLDIDVEILEVDINDDTSWDLAEATARAVLQAVTHHDASSTSRAEVRRAVIEAMAEQLHTAREAFVARLNQDAVAAARATGSLTPAIYQYLAATTPEIRRNRLQAIRLFPLLYPRLVFSPAYAAIRTAIDVGTPLVDAMATYHQVPKSLIRILRGVKPGDIGPWSGDLDTLLSLLRDIAPSWWPRNATTWRLFGETTRLIARLSHAPIISTANRLWLRTCARDGYELPQLPPADLLRIAMDIDEFMGGLREALRWQLRDLVTDQPVDLLVMKLSGQFRASLDVERMGRLARRWGAAYRRAQAALADEMELWRGTRWQSLCEGSLTLGDLTVVPLVTASDMIDEGKQMKNCVATYIGACLRGECQFWSLRSSGQVRISTLETRVETSGKGAPRIQIVEHKGPANSAPSAAAASVAGQLVRHLAEQPVRVDTYLKWKRLVASRSMNERTAIALVRPIIVSLEEVLPKAWTLDQLIVAADFNRLFAF